MTPPDVSDAAVEAAFNAWCDVADVDEWRVRNLPEALRAAIEAAVEVMGVRELLESAEELIDARPGEDDWSRINAAVNHLRANLEAP